MILRLATENKCGCFGGVDVDKSVCGPNCIRRSEKCSGGGGVDGTLGRSGGSVLEFRGIGSGSENRKSNGGKIGNGGEVGWRQKAKVRRLWRNSSRRGEVLKDYGSDNSGCRVGFRGDGKGEEELLCASDSRGKYMSMEEVLEKLLNESRVSLHVQYLCIVFGLAVLCLVSGYDKFGSLCRWYDNN